MHSLRTNSLRQHLHKHHSLFVFSATLLLVGIIFGALIVNSLTLLQKDDLYKYLGHFFTDVQSDHLATPTIIFAQSFWQDVKTIGLMWLLGLSVIGAPIVMGLAFIKGVFVGFTVGFLVTQMGWQGVVLSAFAIMPQNMIIVPVYICVCAMSIAFSMQLIRNQLSTRHRKPFWPIFRQFSIATATLCVLFIVSAAFEAWISPYFMRLALHL
ncbi:stage II sporulation protein M [Aureibacillus halotolerans]|nr:stage II sporulation protein M [Aureibacillus halotolerans]